MGRRKDENSRRSRAARRKAQREAQAAAARLSAREVPNDRILALRETFSFARDTETEGRQGTIDQDICDALGQWHVLGLLDGHGVEAMELRDRGREWGLHYALLMKGLAVKTSSYERTDKAVREVRYSRADERFDRMDGALGREERAVLMSLIVDPLIGMGDMPAWAKAMIDGALIERKRLPVAPVCWPGINDEHLFRTAVRGLVQLVNGEARKEAA